MCPRNHWYNYLLKGHDIDLTLHKISHTVQQNWIYELPLPILKPFHNHFYTISDKRSMRGYTLCLETGRSTSG